MEHRVWELHGVSAMVGNTNAAPPRMNHEGDAPANIIFIFNIIGCRSLLEALDPELCKAADLRKVSRARSA